MRLTTDLFAYCAERLPSFNTISISGYHIREAGSTAVQEIAFTLANGLAYARAAMEAGLSPDDFGERLSFFFNAHNDFFQEVAKFRAARRLWAKLLRERLGVTNEKALALRFHAQTGGSTLTAQQPENNIVRVAVQALSAVCGGAQSVHTNGFDEALALPTEHAARIALRTQQILQHEAGTTDTADPLGGAYFLEALTDELEQQALELIDRVEELGGAVAAIEAGFVQREIEEAAYRYTPEVESGERVVVGVNAFQEDEPEQIELHRLDPEIERRQLERTARVRAERNAQAAEAALAEVRRVAGTDENLLPAMREALARALHRRRDLRDAPRRVGHVRRPAKLRSRGVMSVGEIEVPARPAAAPAEPTVELYSPWRIAWRRFRRDRVAMASGIFLIVLLLAIFPGAKIASIALGHGPDDLFPYAVDSDNLKPLGPWTWVPDTHQLAPTTSDYETPPPPKGTPNTLFLLGADGQLGHDLFLRLLYGGQVSLEVGIGATIIALLIGVTLGMLAGWLGGLVDGALSRLTDLVMALPILLILLMVGTGIGDGLQRLHVLGRVQQGRRPADAADRRVHLVLPRADHAGADAHPPPPGVRRGRPDGRRARLSHRAEAPLPAPRPVARRLRDDHGRDRADARGRRHLPRRRHPAPDRELGLAPRPAVGLGAQPDDHDARELPALADDRPERGDPAHRSRPEPARRGHARGARPGGGQRDAAPGSSSFSAA